MLCLVSGCNLVASKASFICKLIISKQWSFSGSEGQLTDTGSEGRTFLSQKTSESFGAVKNAADTKSAGVYSVILILVCVCIRFLTLHWKLCAVASAKFPHQHDSITCSLRPYVDDIFRQAKHSSIKNKGTTHML